MSKPPIHHGNVSDPDNDGRVSDADRFRDERRREALAMIELWLRSSKLYAGDEIRHWRRVLSEIDRQAGHERAG